MAPHPGDVVRVVMTKWGRRAHWQFDALVLGTDDDGTWLGVPAGTRMVRPGAEYVAPVAQVCLVPPPGRSLDRGWLATFHAAGGPVECYVDMTTPAYWTGTDLNAVDLDLDVVRGPSGRVWVDDEDEFARHRTELGYPEELVLLAVTTAERVRTALRDAHPPFDGRSQHWFAALEDALGDGISELGTEPGTQLGDGRTARSPSAVER